MKMTMNKRTKPNHRTIMRSIKMKAQNTYSSREFKSDTNYVESIVHNLTPEKNGGECIQLYVHFFNNEEKTGNIYWIYELRLNSYGSTSSIKFAMNTSELENLEKAVRNIREYIENN